MNDEQSTETYEAPRLRPLGSLHELTLGGPPGIGVPGIGPGAPFGHWHRGSF